MGVSDIVLIITSLFLGACALFVPYLAEIIKRIAFAPKLVVSFNLNPPDCHKTYWRSQQNTTLNEPVYFFRLKLSNEGKSQARYCEAILEQLWSYNAANQPIKYPNFSPVNLRFDKPENRFIFLNPRRSVYWNIGHLSSPEYQKNEVFIGADLYTGMNKSPKFLFELLDNPFSQPNSLVPGKYKVKIVFYSENAPAIEMFLEIVWSGKWMENESEIFKEFVITQLT